MTGKQWRLSVIDGGSRYGLHPTWEHLAGVSDFVLVEPDQLEAERLAEMYKAWTNVSVVQSALGSTMRSATFNRAEHHGLTSEFQPNFSLLAEHRHMVDEFAPLAPFSANVVTIDSLERTPDFLKLDIEGNELDALHGAEIALSDSLLGIRSEVQFNEVWNNAPFFSDIDSYLRSKGFQLLNIDYDGKGVAKSRFAETNRFGTLLTSDAVWIASPELLKRRTKSKSDSAVVSALAKLSLFCFNNLSGDVGIDYAEQMQRIYHGPIATAGNKLFERLEEEVARHLKTVSYVPSISQDEINAIYFQLFGNEFPRAHRYYQRPKAAR